MGNKTSRFPLVTTLILLIAGTLLWKFHVSQTVTIATLALSCIALIIFGERFAFDDALESRMIPGRDALFPIIAMGIAIALGAVDPATIPKVFADKVDIICLILSFAIVSEGIARSGYFAFAANKIVTTCGGNTTRLILYMYVLASILAYFTSNDIVILVLTPVLFSICVHARITNTRLLLLSEFVAANGMAMGTLIGSPTNIIFGDTMNVSYVDYFLMMILPTILCGILSLIVIDWINKQSRGGGLFAKRWSYEETYRIPAAGRYMHFTPAMRTWLAVFAFDVVLLAVVSSLHTSLLWAAVPIAGSAIFFLYRGTVEETDNTEKAATDIKHILRSLPFSIFFFGTVFFSFSDEISRLHFVQDTALPWARAHLFDDVVHASFGTIILTVGVVNSINDLPAAALLSDILKHIDASGQPLNEYLRLVVMQAIMIGLNIGCYVTPVGALAGLMWFNIIRREERRQAAHALPDAKGAPRPRMLTPSRGDMMLYGLLHFMFVTLVMGFILPFFVNIVDLLISSPNVANETSMPGLISIRGDLPYIGLGLLVFTFFMARAALMRSGVLLGHLRDVFVVMTRFTIWSMRNRIVYLLILGSTLLAAASGVLYWAETTHEHVFGRAEGSKGLFDSLSSFFIWAMVFSGAGLSDAYKPHSAIGMALTSILPVIVIGGIVMIAQLSSEKTLQQLARRMAIGEIPGYRIVIVNFRESFRKFVDTILHNRNATVLLLCGPEHIEHANAYCARKDQEADTACRTYAALKYADPTFSIKDYGLADADEIYLLSDMTPDGEYDKIRYLAQLDSSLNALLRAMMEGIEIGVQEGTIESGHVPEITDLQGIPKIFVETLSEKYDSVMQKTSSLLFRRTTINADFERDVTDLLISDVDIGMASLNRYFRLGVAPPPGLFRDDKSPLARYCLKDFALDAEGREIFRRHFAGARSVGDLSSTAMTASRVRALVDERTQGAHYVDGRETRDLDPVNLYGITIDAGGAHVHLSIPSAALSLQPISAERVILKTPVEISAMPVLPNLSGLGERRIFIFNVTLTAQSFIRKLIPLLPKGAQRLVLLSTGDSIPDDIRGNPAVRVVEGASPEALARAICPSLAERAEGRGKDAAPIMDKGDRMYIFLERHGKVTEADSVDFIDHVDSRLQEIEDECAAKKQASPISHPDVYIAMVVQDWERRSMLKNFCLDKIIDTSLPRQSYLETLSKIFHRMRSEGQASRDIQDTVFNFRRAAEIADHLCHFTTDFAEDLRLQDDSGTEISLLGKTMDEATSDMRAYTLPPQQLFTRVRISSVPRGAKRHGSSTFDLVEVPDNEPIRAGDLLVSIPII